MNALVGLVDYGSLQSEYTTQRLLSFFIFGLWVKTSGRYFGRQGEPPFFDGLATPSTRR
jgi:hypothetical protein